MFVRIASLASLLFAAACTVAPAPTTGTTGAANDPTSSDDVATGEHDATNPSAPSSAPASGGSSTAPASGADCHAEVIPAGESGGCFVRLVSPQPCEEIDLSNGQSYEFA